MTQIGNFSYVPQQLHPTLSLVHASLMERHAAQQYAGRLHREHAGKTDVRIIDFLDTGHPVLLRMWDKRQIGYRAMGYRLQQLAD